jgi:hypothetical protein
MAAPPTAMRRALVLTGMLFFGTCTVFVQKFLFGQSANGRTDLGYKNPHDFRKPWFQTSSMFLGMFLALIVYEIQQFLKKPSTNDLVLQSASEEAFDAVQPASKNSHWKFYIYVCAPALCDLLATALSNIGLLFIEASVWQMLRGSMVLFSSIFCAFILKRPHYPYMWWSVLLVVIALVIVGYSSVASTGVGKAGSTPGQVVLAIVLTVVAQIVQATQIVIEEFLLHDMVAAPTFIVGLEGLWGAVITWAVFIPIVGATSGAEGNGVHEDTKDTFIMMGNNPVIIVLVLVYVCVILAYNVTAMMVTQIASAVIRTIMEALRTLCIWIAEIILFYALKWSNSEYGKKHPDLGEELTPWSILELAGFLLLISGTLLYNKILQMPFFHYPPKPEEIPAKVVDPQPLITSGYD